MAFLRKSIAVAAAVLTAFGAGHAQNSFANEGAPATVFAGFTEVQFNDVLVRDPNIEIVEKQTINEGTITGHIWTVTAHGLPIALSLLCESEMPKCYFVNVVGYYDVPFPPTLSRVLELNAESFVPYLLEIDDGDLYLSGNLFLNGVTALHISSQLELFPAVYLAYAQELGVAANSIATDMGSDGLNSEDFNLAALPAISGSGLVNAVARERNLAKINVNIEKLMKDAQTRAALTKVLSQPGH